MHKLIKFLNGEIIGVDKMLHFSFSFIIASFFTNHIIGLSVVLAVGIAKEIFDKYKKKTKFDTYDIIAGLSGAGFYILTQYILKWKDSQDYPY